MQKAPRKRKTVEKPSAKRKRDEGKQKSSEPKASRPAAKKPKLTETPTQGVQKKAKKGATDEKDKPAIVTRVPMQAASPNWKELMKSIPKPKPMPPRRKKASTTAAPTAPAITTAPSAETSTAPTKPRTDALAPPKFNDKSLTKYIALDCEMVGVGIDGKESMLARVCIVNSHGNIIYDKHVKPREDVVDYRTKWSGIRPENLTEEAAVDFVLVQKEVAEVTKGRIVVGHALENDFKALLLDHPFSLTRDTAKYRPFQRSRGKPSALRYLANKLLGVTIQSGEHAPDEDARTALLLYKFARKEWEDWLKRRTGRLKKKAKKQQKPIADANEEEEGTH